MEEALEILWTYARREPLDSNGETVVPTINNSIAAIRIIMRLEGWAMGSEKRTIPNKPTRNCRGKIRESRAGERFTQHNTTNSDNPECVQPQYPQHNTDNNTNNHNEGELLTYSAAPVCGLCPYTDSCKLLVNHFLLTTNIILFLLNLHDKRTFSHFLSKELQEMCQ